MTALFTIKKTESLELQAEGEEVNQSQSLGMRIVIGLSFRFSFQLRFSLGHKQDKATES